MIKYVLILLFLIVGCTTKFEIMGDAKSNPKICNSIPDGKLVPSGDICNTCTCFNGNVACTQIVCSTDTTITLTSSSIDTPTETQPKIGHVTLNTHPLIDMDSEFTEVYVLEITSKSTINIKFNNHLYTFRVGEVDLANGKVSLSAVEIGLVRLNLHNSTSLDLDRDYRNDLNIELENLIDEYAEIYFKRI